MWKRAASPYSSPRPVRKGSVRCCMARRYAPGIQVRGPGGMFMVEWRSMPPTETPRELYAERRSARQSVADALTRRERTLSIARLVSIGLAILITFWSVAAALLPVIVFIVLVIVHERVVRERKRAGNRAAFYARGLAR